MLNRETSGKGERLVLLGGASVGRYIDTALIARHLEEEKSLAKTPVHGMKVAERKVGCGAMSHGIGIAGAGLEPRSDGLYSS